MRVLKGVQVGSLGRGDALVQVEPAGGPTGCQRVIISGDPTRGSELESSLGELKEKYLAEDAAIFVFANTDTPDWVVLARMETALLRATTEEATEN